MNGQPDGTIGRDRWVAAATAAMRVGGTDAVRVEALARDLGVTKGSFYWHFRDRAELLDALLAAWEEETRWLVREAASPSDPRARLLRYFALLRSERRHPPDVEVLAWARREPAVRSRVEATERRRLRFFAEQLTAAGLAPAEAARRAHTAYLATQGWIERMTREAEDAGRLDPFIAHLFDLLLAPEPAPSHTPPSTEHSSHDPSYDPVVR